MQGTNAEAFLSGSHIRPIVQPVLFKGQHVASRNVVLASF